MRLNQAFSVLIILAGGAPTKRISLRNSTSKASWEWDDEFKKNSVPLPTYLCALLSVIKNK
ncbi:hypothetical protein BUZ32_01325 [Staphylococcus haemolyticus]|nr:hypothetical protein BUZ44_04270 [Staphylococcus haemolyticus]PTK69551.1 hypothetical protein BUZ32_01325 [Staphylococcus haemolyticus]PTK72830.1 hypothetical protein BUZ29_07590 [Staphylococcus haemolyticus]PTL03620.1 hypothetical protein BUZ18_03675 [Staphylococcus haemolyticus]RIO61884.1 hypothetical protein BUZ42_00735 [Staphylococcus haemolyticus]